MKYEVCHLSVTTDTLPFYFIKSLVFKWWYVEKFWNLFGANYALYMLILLLELF